MNQIKGLKEEIEIYVFSIFSPPGARVPVNPKTYLRYCTVRAWQACFRRIGHGHKTTKASGGAMTQLPVLLLASSEN